MTSLIFHRAIALWSLKDLIWPSCWLLGCVTETLSQQQDTGCNRKHWEGAVVLTDTSRLVLVTGFKPKTLCEWQKASMFDCSLERKPCHTCFWLGLNTLRTSNVDWFMILGNADVWGSQPKHAAQTVSSTWEVSVSNVRVLGATDGAKCA